MTFISSLATTLADLSYCIAASSKTLRSPPSSHFTASVGFALSSVWCEGFSFRVPLIFDQEACKSRGENNIMGISHSSLRSLGFNPEMVQLCGERPELKVALKLGDKAGVLTGKATEVDTGRPLEAVSDKF
jgi:hypothetical protein